MTRKEAERLSRQSDILQSLGFTQDEADKLRRISMTLQRWHELECGTVSPHNEMISLSVERETEEPDSKPYLRKQYHFRGEWVDTKYAIPDRETGAKKRLAKILNRRNDAQLMNGEPIDVKNPPLLTAFIQTDPRGAALYILRPGDVPEGEDVSAYYNRGICVY